MFCKPHPYVYTLLFPIFFVVHLTFHVSKLKPFSKYKRRLDRRQTYHSSFDFIEHRFATKVGEKKTRCLGSKVEGMPLERGNMGEIFTFRPSTGNGEGIKVE